MQKKIFYLVTVVFCFILAACGSEEINKVRADNKTTDKFIQVELPIVTNSGSLTYILTNEDMKALFAEINPNLIKDFSTENLEIKVPNGKYNYDGKVYSFELNEAQVSKFLFNQKQHLSLYFYKIELEYATDVEINTLAQYNPDVVLLNHYTGEKKKYTLNPTKEFDLNDEYNEEQTALAVSEIMYSMNEAELQNDIIIEKLLPVSASAETSEIAKEGYEYIVKNYVYDSSQTNDNNYISLQEFIESKKGICNQFAYLYKLYLDYNDIENRLAFGNFDGVEGEVNHVWNEVKIDDEWVSVDTTGNGFGSEGAYENYVISHYSSY